MNSEKENYKLNAIASNGLVATNEIISHEELNDKISALISLGWQINDYQWGSKITYCGTLGPHYFTASAEKIQERKEVAA